MLVPMGSFDTRGVAMECVWAPRGDTLRDHGIPTVYNVCSHAIPWDVMLTPMGAAMGVNCGSHETTMGRPWPPWDLPWGSPVDPHYDPRWATMGAPWDCTWIPWEPHGVSMGSHGVPMPIAPCVPIISPVNPMGAQRDPH